MTLTNFTVRYDQLATQTDGSDAGADSDTVALIGEAVFTAYVSDDKPVLAKNYSPRPAGFKLLPITGYLDSDGQLKSVRSGTVGVRLPANDPVLELPSLFYKVEFRNMRTPIGERVRVDGGFFEAPSTDTEVNLADVLTSTGSTASGVMRSQPYAEDIIDSGSVGRALVQSNTQAAAWTALGTVPSNNLPSYVDDVLEYLNLAAFPASGETGKIYLDKSTGDIYRWSGTVYVRISVNPYSGEVFNWRPDNTRRIQRSIAKAIAGQAANHLVIGDSVSQCYTEGFNWLSVWPYLLRNMLSLRGVPLGGTGWVATGNANPDSPTTKDPRWTTTGTWTDVYGDLASSGSGATLTFTSDLPGTIVEIAYPSTSGAFTVAIDSAAPVTVTPAGGTLALAKSSYTGLADTTHTVTITRVSGTVTIYGVRVSKTNGLQIHNLALSGISAQNWAADSLTPRTRGWIVNRLGLTPDLVHIALGVNDLNYSRTPAQCAADIATIAAKWPNSDIVLWAELAPESNSTPTLVTTAMWDEYVSRLRTLAETLDCPLVDLHRRSGGSRAAAFAAGLMSGDGIHPTKVLHGDWAMLAANLITGVQK